MEIKKKYVWRMQNERKIGPYEGDMVWNGRWSRRGQNPDPHPGPNFDGIDMIKYAGWKFGFKTRKAAFEWFDQKDRADLDAFGYTIQKVACKKVKNSDSGRQCVWK